ncbi:MAG: 4-hydroxy-3-methylbut-2-enyl diphosphate reductase [Candidatus Omnitrophica bacterium]|nr:4-hydroxy-3-methylbut-2-enyl diphosphate reductase [Candidatus Omnitrophota bacterium]
MKINLAKSAGFCFGVKRALELAQKASHRHKRLCVWGEIVHNQEVMQRLGQAGIKKINRLKPNPGTILILPAHGVALNIIEQAKQCGYRIIDATCPMVKQIHKIVRDADRKDYPIIIIGDKRHTEVKGIKGQIKNKALIIENEKDIPFKKIKRLKRVCVVAQSTQNLETVLKILDILKLYIKEIKFFNTVCQPTRIKQTEIRKMPLENEVMIIIGSKNSANTRRLYEISKSLNKKSFWVSAKEEVKPAWFKGIKKVGVTAGASTPQSTIEEIIQSIKNVQ